MPLRFCWRLSHVVAVALALLSCSEEGGSGGVPVSLKVTDPNDLKALSAWAELSIFEEGCPNEEDLASGSYPKPFRQTTFAVSQEYPGATPLDPKVYGIAALLRQEDCGVVGFGCVRVDASKNAAATIRIFPTYQDENGNLLPEGACTAGQTCIQGRCKGGGAGGSSAGGAGGAGGS